MIRAALWRRMQKLFGELSVGFAINRSQVRFPVGAMLCNNCGQVDFFSDDAVVYRITSISCYKKNMIFDFRSVDPALYGCVFYLTFLIICLFVTWFYGYPVFHGTECVECLMALDVLSAYKKLFTHSLTSGL